MFSQIGTFLGFLLLGVANALPLIFLARIIDGLSGANVAVAQAALTDSTTEKTRAQGLGLLGAAFGLGFIIGPVIAFAALGLSGNDYHAPALAAAGFSLLSIILTAVMFKETLPPEKRGAHRGEKRIALVGNIIHALRQPVIGILLILMFLQQLIFGGFEYLISLFTLNRLGVNGSGNALIFVFVGIIIVLIQGKYIGPWSRKYGEHKLIYAALILLAVGLTLTALTPAQTVPWYSRTEMIRELNQNTASGPEEGVSASTVSVPIPEDGSSGWLGLVWILVAMIPAAVGGGLLSPSINSLITKRAGTEVGSTLGVSSALVSTANAITPIVGGSIFSILGSTAPFLIGGIVLGGLYFVARQTVKPGPGDLSATVSAPS
jgi:DHA1 family tetracycline resistance protein-like MFS transporter